MAVKYSEGDWFAVPTGSGYAVGVVARASPSGILLGYFFGPARRDLPELDAIQSLEPGMAALVGHFAPLGLKDGRWPVIGTVPGWERARWTTTELIRYEELTGRSFRVIYDADDPNKLLREERIIPGVAEQGPKDGLMGAEYVENLLARLLKVD